MTVLWNNQNSQFEAAICRICGERWNSFGAEIIADIYKHDRSNTGHIISVGLWVRGVVEFMSQYINTQEGQKLREDVKNTIMRIRTEKEKL